MQKVFITISALFFSFSAWSAPRQFQIDSKLFYQGKKVSSPRLLTTEGKKAKLMQVNQRQKREYSVEMVPTRSSNNKVHIKYNVVVREGRDETISRGELLVPENKDGRISIDHGRIQLYLKVKES